MAEREVWDLIVETPNPTALDETMNQAPFGAAVVDGTWNGTTCHVRCFGNHDFVSFAIDQQGYGRVVGQERVE